MRPTVGIVVIQPTPFCNIDCTYCYLPERGSRSRIALETVRALFEKVFASGWTGGELTVIWHAGEPLVLPPDFYEEAFQVIDSLRPAGLNLVHSFQTNGTLISQAWCDLFKRWSVGVGVSVDGPRHFNDQHRLTRDGRSTFDKTLSGIRMLRAESVPFHVISVLSAASLRAPEEMLEFYISEGIEDVCFNVEESEGAHVSALFASESPRDRYRDFLGEFWRLARQSGRIRFIREIDGMLPRIFRPDEERLRNIQTEPFGMLNVDCHGNVSTFSPELLGLKDEKYKDFLIGNIRTDSLEEMSTSESLCAMARDVAAGVEACRNACPYFSICGGGAPINKLAENGSFASAATTFCTLTQMVPAELILDAFAQLNQHVERCDVPPPNGLPGVMASYSRRSLADAEAATPPDILSP